MVILKLATTIKLGGVLMLRQACRLSTGSF